MMPVDSLTITQDNTKPGTFSMKMKGELTMLVQPILAEQIKIIEQGDYQKIEMDLSELYSISGAGLKYLNVFIAQIRRNGLLIAAFGLSREIKTIFELTCLNEVVELR